MGKTYTKRALGLSFLALTSFGALTILPAQAEVAADGGAMTVAANDSQSTYCDPAAKNKHYQDCWEIPSDPSPTTPAPGQPTPSVSTSVPPTAPSLELPTLNIPQPTPSVSTSVPPTAPSLELPTLNIPQPTPSVSTPGSPTAPDRELPTFDTTSDPQIVEQGSVASEQHSQSAATPVQHQPLAPATTNVDSSANASTNTNQQASGAAAQSNSAAAAGATVAQPHALLQTGSPVETGATIVLFAAAGAGSIGLIRALKH